MEESKKLSELFNNIEALSENSQGLLKGGFVVLSPNDLSLEDIFNEATNNCRCKNKNRDAQCAGCSNDTLEISSL